MRSLLQFRLAPCRITRTRFLGISFAVAAFLAGGAEPEDSTLNGRWNWNFVMPDGTVVSPVARLKLEGTTLTGTSKFRHATETPISEGHFEGDLVRFQVVRQINDRKVITRYTGKFHDKRITGSIESNWNGETQTYPWEAKRLPDTAEGTWKWVTTVRERKLEFTVKIKQEGDKLTGKLNARKGTGDEIKHGKFKDGLVTFEVERERGGEWFSSSFSGKLVGDIIRGKELDQIDGLEQTFDWVAVRSD